MKGDLLGTFRDMDSRTRTRLGMIVAGVLLVAVALTAINGRIAALEKKRNAREADLSEMLLLKVRYQQANAVAQRLNNRLAATRADDSPAKIIDEIGIKGKGSQIKPVKGDDVPGFAEDAAEVKIDGLSANEAVNLIYKLEKGMRPVTVKKALLKQRFDDPAKLDLSLTVALLKPAPQGMR